jgi:hypothetical protein
VCGETTGSQEGHGEIGDDHDSQREDKMSGPKSILEIFEETEKENRKVCEKVEAENAAKARTEERKLADLEARLEKERGILAGMMADYGRIEGELQTAAAAEIEAKGITAARMKAGEISVDEFLRAGLNAQAIKKQAADETKAKLADVWKMIREKRVEIYRLEDDFAAANYTLGYLTAASPKLRLEKLKEEVESFQRSLNPVAEACMAAGNAAKKAKENFLLAQGKGIFNLIWDNLTFGEIQDLRFDPRIPEALIPEVEGFLLSADPTDHFRGKLVFTGGRPPVEISFSALNYPHVVDFGKPIIRTGDLK